VAKSVDRAWTGNAVACHGEGVYDDVGAVLDVEGLALLLADRVVEIKILPQKNLSPQSKQTKKRHACDREK